MEKHKLGRTGLEAFKVTESKVTSKGVIVVNYERARAMR